MYQTVPQEVSNVSIVTFHVVCRCLPAADMSSADVLGPSSTNVLFSNIAMLPCCALRSF